MKKIIIFTLMFVGAVQVGAQQPDMTFKYDPELFLGKWEAKQGHNSYELIISEYRFYPNSEMEIHFDMLVGEITYKVDGVVTRHEKPEGFNAAFVVFGAEMLSPYSTEFLFSEKGKNIEGYGEFTIHKNDPTKAQWKFQKGSKYPIEWPSLRGKDWNKKDFDIPLNLQWRKVE